MDLSFSTEQNVFRAEVQAFLEDGLDAELARKVEFGLPLTKDDIEGWHATLNARGWLVPSWPAEYGGTDWGPVEKFIFEDECSRANAPRLLPFGINMLAPVLLKFGTKQQCDHYLPRIRDGQDWWCQGYSEPGAGSDLASLKTRAVRDGDHYVVNGQKTWTTLAQYADWIFCLVRTSTEGKPQEGISFLLIDMKSPGIEVRPITTIDGGQEINEVFFSDVRVPAENLVGEENKGWTYAKYLLTHERTNIATVGISKKKMERLRRIAREEPAGEGKLADDPLFAARMAEADIRLRNMETTNLRVLSAVEQGGAPVAESSMLKILGSEISQELDSLIRRAGGHYAPAGAVDTLDPGYNGAPIGPDYAATAAAIYFNDRKLSIYGGSNEIQKNIITKMVLGL